MEEIQGNVQIVPQSTLTFRKPPSNASPSDYAKSIITIANKEDFNIAFKVKTTAPKKYCVRPNSGIIKRDSQQEIQVLRQPIKEKENEDETKSKDKFLIQWVAVAHEKEVEDAELSALWAEYEKIKKNEIQERRLKCEVISSHEDGGEKAPVQPSELSEKPVHVPIKENLVSSLPEKDQKKDLEQQLQLAFERNRQLTQENTQLKRQAQAPAATSTVSVKAPSKVKPPLDTTLILLVSLIALVLGFQLAKIFAD